MTEQEKAFEKWGEINEGELNHYHAEGHEEGWLAALDWAAQGQEPVAKTVTGRREVACHGPGRRYVDGIVIRQLKEIEPETNLYAHPAPAVAQEPVAWIFPSDLQKFAAQEASAYAYSVACCLPEEKTVPLYAHPPAPVQLTDTKIFEIAQKYKITSALAEAIIKDALERKRGGV